MGLEQRIKRLERTNRILIALVAIVFLTGQGRPADGITLQDPGGNGSIALEVTKDAAVLRMTHKNAPADIRLECGRISGVRGAARMILRNGDDVTRVAEVAAPIAESGEARARAKVRDLHDKVKMWMILTKSEPPESFEPLAKPIGGFDAPYLVPEKDPWGREYGIETLGKRKFRVVSSGPDGKRGTEDDIAYPEK